ncbi:sn-glycerol 3-phosphate transport system permease protein [Herbaspirillum sp. Sphag1AN]|nr:sn-glycerol 3-phosphate transport system permease protein [Herbaspirillum sp. Sphag1AN]MBB3245542.1 sn-glycerol 3-phosphate transport system permease protein [Herbaspirillum sp. Sphag64]
MTTLIESSPRNPIPTAPATNERFWRVVDTGGAWLLALCWMAPLLFAVWAALHQSDAALRFDLHAPLLLDNFRLAWQSAPWLRYFCNTFLLVTLILAGQLTLCTLAGFAFARFQFAGKNLLFVLVLLQLFVLPEILIVENYAMVTRLGLFDTPLGMAAPYMASAFGIFLLRQAFMQIPRELEEAARIEGCSWFGVLWRVYVPAARPVYLAYALVSVATHWNNFLWPLIVTNSSATRPLTVGLSLFGAPESGVNISLISAATLMAIAPLLVGFLVFQRQFIQAFLRAGIR